MAELPRWLKDLGETADALFIVDPGRKILVWNACAERTFGYAAEEALGERCCDLLAGRTCAGKAWCHSNCQVQRVISRGATLKNFDLMVRARDGRDVCTNISIIGIPHRRRRLTVHIARPLDCRDRYRETLGKIRDLIREAGALNGAPNHADGEDAIGPADPNGLAPLTAREVEVLSLVADGFPNAAIARRLSISSFTVRNHVQSVLGKLGLHSKAQAVCFAFKRRLLE